jgi:hypothetical protein
MRAVRQYEVHVDFDLTTPYGPEYTEAYGPEALDVAVDGYKNVVSKDHYNVRLVAAYIDDWDEDDMLILAFHYPEDSRKDR